MLFNPKYSSEGMLQDAQTSESPEGAVSSAPPLPGAALGASMTQHLLCFQPELFIRRFSVLFCLLQEILCLIK